MHESRFEIRMGQKGRGKLQRAVNMDGTIRCASDRILLYNNMVSVILACDGVVKRKKVYKMNLKWKE